LVANFEIIALENGSIFIGRGLWNIFLITLEIGWIFIGLGFWNVFLKLFFFFFLIKWFSTSSSWPFSSQELGALPIPH
jgi:hypothetical protein